MGKVAALTVAVLFIVGTTGCSRKRSNINTHGLTYCDGNLGQFDVYTVPSQGGLYELYVVPYRPTQPGDLVSIYISNQNRDNPQILKSEAVIQADGEIYLGAVTGNQLQASDVLTIQPYGQGAGFLQGNYANEAQFCSIPIPGDNPTVQ